MDTRAFINTHKIASLKSPYLHLLKKPSIIKKFLPVNAAISRLIVFVSKCNELMDFHVMHIANAHK